MEQITNIVDRHSRIGALNDALRCHGRGGMIVVTSGIAQLPPDTGHAVYKAVAEFTAFDGDNDPYGERDSTGRAASSFRAHSPTWPYRARTASWSNSNGSPHSRPRRLSSNSRGRVRTGLWSRKSCRKGSAYSIAMSSSTAVWGPRRAPCHRCTSDDGCRACSTLVLSIRCRRGEPCPIFHHRSTAFKQVAAPLGRFNLIFDGMSERHLRHLPRVACCLGSPIPKRGPKAMCGHFDLHPPQLHREHHVGHRVIQ